MPNTTRFIVLRDLIAELRTMGTRLEEASEIDNAECLRECADALQSVREHFWPMWLEASRQAQAEKLGITDA